VKVQDEVHKAVERAIKEHRKLHDATAEEATHQLVSRGYLQEEPPVALVAEAVDIVEAEEQAFAPGVHPADL
jgi:hypothetical protein